MVDEREPRQVVAVAPPEYYQPVYYQEDEIDLHHYVNILLRYWWLVVGVPLVAVIVAGIMGFLVMEKTYKATALVAVTSPRYIVQLSDEFETVPLSERQLPVKAYPALATSADLLQQLLGSVSQYLPEEQRTLTHLSGMVSAASGSDASVIELTVTYTDPAVAAAIANVWADQFAAMVQNVYGQSTEEVSTFEAQLAQADARRTAAENAVIEFAARNPVPSLEAQIADQQAALAEYLSTKRTIDRVIGDAVTLRDRLSGQPASAESTFTDDLAALLLEVGSLSTSSTGSPLQLQIQSDSLPSGKTVGDQIDYLDGLTKALEASSAELDAKIAALEPEMLALQQDLEEAQTELDRLTEERDIARDLYHSLTLKLEEARLEQDTNTREVQVAARAVEPTVPASPRKMMMLGVAGSVGLMVGVLAAFVVNFFRSNGSAENA